MAKRQQTRFNPPPNWPVGKGFSPPPGWQPDPAWGPPPPGWPLWVTYQKKGRTGLIIGSVVGALSVLCLIGIIVAAVNAGDGNNKGGSTADEPAATAGAPGSTANKPQASLGTPVRDGKFEFTVKDMRCGVSEVGTVLTQAADGQFCLVTSTVENIGDRAQTLDAGSQKAKNATGQVFSADSVASFHVNDKNQTFLNEINPGNVVTGVVAFDIPKNQRITMLELHDSPFSRGVDVSVS